MSLGQKIRQARQEAGLSQRQLCGDALTRNMLSQIENDSANPSIATLRYLAVRLDKGISFFLEEETVTSPNQAVMQKARQAFEEKKYETAAAVLADYREPDGVFDREKWLLEALTSMELGKKALGEGKLPYAKQLLEAAAAAGGKTPYYSGAMERQRLLLLAGTGQRPLGAMAAQLEPDDSELLLRAAAALEVGNAVRSAALLEAAEDREAPGWNLLRGDAFFQEKQYRDAAACYKKAEQIYPNRCIPRLEQCYRELEDYKRAYEYACKQR